MSVHERLREYFFYSKTTATELAKEIDISQSSLNNVVNGNNLPSSKLLIELASKKNLSINWLLLGDGKMFREKTRKVQNFTPKQSSTKLEELLERLYEMSEENKVIWTSLLEEKDQRLIEKERIIASKDAVIELLQEQNGK